MTKLLSLTELTDQAVKEQTEALAQMDDVPGETLMQAVRENLEHWEEKLFPLLKARKVSRYEYLVELLEKAGYKSIKPENLCVIVNKVRKERNNRG